MGECEITLPVGIGQVGRGEALGDGEGVAECGQRLVEAALRLEGRADAERSDGELALPAGIGQVGRGEALEDGEGVTKWGQRLVEAALRLEEWSVLAVD